MKRVLILIIVFVHSFWAQRYFNADTVAACLGDTLFLYLNRPVSKNATIRWLTPYASIYNTRKINVTRAAGKYVVYVNENGKVIKDSTQVVFFPRPVFNIPDTNLCWGRKFIPKIPINPMYFIRWSHGENGNDVTIRQSGIYWAEAYFGGCRYRDTFRVNYLQTEDKVLPAEVKFCISDENKIIQVQKASAKVKYEWSNGSLGPVTRVDHEGKYYLKMYYPGCGYRTDSVNVKFKTCDCEILIPNTFSPNDDNRNDYFFPVLQCEYASYQLTIFDKYGNVLFHTNHPEGRWDGKFKGIPCEEDIYVYKIETVERAGERRQVRSGRVSLIR